MTEQPVVPEILITSGLLNYEGRYACPLLNPPQRTADMAKRDRIVPPPPASPQEQYYCIFVTLIFYHLGFRGDLRQTGAKIPPCSGSFRVADHRSLPDLYENLYDF
jgi:hypothetical protein